jgi:N-acetylglucosamine malate deacetylase 2
MTLRSAAAFFAHPDDETVLAGGIIALLSQLHIPTHIVCATRGEGGETGAPLLSIQRTQLGSIREQELRCAAQALGASVQLLGYVDPLIGEDEALYPFEADFYALVRQMIDIIRERNTNLVLTHGADGEYGHPAHQLMHRAVVTAVREIYPAILLYSVAASVPEVEDRLWNQNEMAHFALDIRPWAEQKLKAMECHATQHALFIRRRGLQSVREALRTVESVRRVLPETHGELPEDAFAEILRNAGAWTPGQDRVR